MTIDLSLEHEDFNERSDGWICQRNLGRRQPDPRGQALRHRESGRHTIDLSSLALGYRTEGARDRDSPGIQSEWFFQGGRGQERQVRTCAS